MNDAILRVENLSAGYERKPILHDIDFSLQKGEFVAVLGPNGSGKSTLMKCLIGYLSPESGDIRYGERGSLRGLSRKESAKHIALVPQETPFHFPYRVYDYVLLGRRPYQGLFRSLSEEDVAACETAMQRTDIWHLKDRIVTELSGGERQRVVLASAFAQETDVLLLDEPTNSLDLRYQLQVYELLSKMKKACGLSIIAVTHDLNLAALHADRIAILNNGRIVKMDEPKKMISSDIIKQYFGVESTVILDEASERPFILSHRSVSTK